MARGHPVASLAAEFYGPPAVLSNDPLSTDPLPTDPLPTD
jgi:hypothetical protein